ncbi:hypothetical protein O181_022837 [Austropuccinia psidii MF-1]|uniref:Uncharacterized protein n=1 Tax=Austropuccinia psidii MF-1 TaxID=1389203 RepID=A0A9Q3CID2_9BASI|nr:hypothetical protein [Austropuccinia psidii MF-1]
MEIAICNRVISHTGLFQNIRSDRDLKLNSSLWKNHHSLFGIKLTFSTANNTQTDVLAEIMIQTLEYIIIIFWAYGLEFKDTDGCNTPYWCTLILAPELTYKKSICSSTGRTTKML